MMEPALQIKFERQGKMLANRVEKRFNHLRKRFARQNIEVFRLYDWDIPEIRAVVDWYDGHLVIGEYTRQQSVAEWLPRMGTTVAAALGVPAEKVHLKERRAGRQGGRRYARIDHTNRKIIVSERDLRFFVNPCDFVDTGLFSDFRGFPAPRARRSEPGFGTSIGISAYYFRKIVAGPPRPRRRSGRPCPRPPRG
ncbi:MAG: hypothetical protein JJV98_18625 [Desulfosarcina sp.]|nr:hypothetical protein [Desulfobacterales bacterium]